MNDPVEQVHHGGVLNRLGRELILNGILASRLCNAQMRVRAFRRLGIPVGENTRIESGSFFGGRNFSVGAHSFINYDCMFDENAIIRIGDHVEIGMQSLFTTSSHPITGPEHRSGQAVLRPIDVGSGSWLGARVTVLPGVVIGSGCVIAAGAVVAKDCEPNGLYAGVPARRIRDLQP